MTVPEEGFPDLIKFLRSDENEYKRIYDTSAKIWDYTSTIIGNRDFWQVSERELRFLYTVTKIFRPGIVAETGVGPGSTSYAYLSALGEYGGKLLSFDLGKRYGNEEKEEKIGFLVPEEMKKNWELIIGDSRNTLEKNLSRYGKIGIFMHDSNHTHEHVKFELETAWKFMDKKFIMIVDNFDWTSAPQEFANEHGLSLFRVSDDMCFLLMSHDHM